MVCGCGRGKSFCYVVQFLCLAYRLREIGVSVLQFSMNFMLDVWTDNGLQEISLR